MENTNKTIIDQFYKNVVKLRKSELIPQYIHENYTQHSPMGKDGREGLVDMVEFLKTMPAPAKDAKSPIENLIAEDDYVVVHLDIIFMGKRTIVIELFRLQCGVATEHWDVTENLIDKSEPFIHISDAIKDVAVDNKGFIAELYQQRENVYIHHLISEDDYVAVHAELKGEKHMALFDIFKIIDNVIVEHHFVKQEVPEKMMHNNGMF